jgi:predicted NBD/HSP70 family sugar kinase
MPELMRALESDDTAQRPPFSAGHILQMVRAGQTSRAEIARVTGLSRSTVSQRIGALLELGLVVEEGDARSTGGRPATRIQLNRTGGEVLAEQTGLRAIADGPSAILGWVRETFLAQLAGLGLGVESVVGVGIGVPGPVEFAVGRAVKPPIMPGWHGVSIPDHFAEALPGVEVLVDNDVNIMAAGEYRTTWRTQVGDLVFVKVATGIGAGIIAGGRLQRGAQGAAGDIGHIRASEHTDAVCACGNAGCIEAVASGSALARRLRALGRDTTTSRDVVELVDHGDADAVRLVREAGRLLGEVLASAVNLLNPSVLVIGGDLAKAEQHLFAGIREAIYRRSTILATGHLQIARSQLGDRAGVIGAAALVLDHRLSPAVVDRMLAERVAA